MATANMGNFFGSFPRLKKSKFQILSPESIDYNCVAWAVGINDMVYWPTGMTFWPLNCPRAETIEAFVTAFATLRYQPCKDGKSEQRFEKIALYAKEGKPKHAARQLRSGKWTSKLGSSFDIKHDLEDLEGGVYGNVVLHLRRSLQDL